jgi:hypothetical protein
LVDELLKFMKKQAAQMLMEHGISSSMGEKLVKQVPLNAARPPGISSLVFLEVSYFAL